MSEHTELLPCPLCGESRVLSTEGSDELAAAQREIASLKRELRDAYDLAARMEAERLKELEEDAG